MNTFKNIVLSLSFFLLSIAIVYSCNCPIVKDLNKIQEYEYENSECIFVGEVLSVNLDNHTFEIEVIESFDETNSGTIYTGKYDPICGPRVNEKGMWLIYGFFETNSILMVNSCGLTRSFRKPEYCISVPMKMTPAPEKDEYDAWKKEWNKNATEILATELQNLRKKNNTRC